MNKNKDKQILLTSHNCNCRHCVTEELTFPFTTQQYSIQNLYLISKNAIVSHLITTIKCRADSNCRGGKCDRRGRRRNSYPRAGCHLNEVISPESVIRLRHSRSPPPTSTPNEPPFVISGEGRCTEAALHTHPLTLIYLPPLRYTVHVKQLIGCRPHWGFEHIYNRKKKTRLWAVQQYVASQCCKHLFWLKCDPTTGYIECAKLSVPVIYLQCVTWLL